MFCSKCGNKSPSGARFCQKCGAKVAAKVNSTAHLLNHPASLAELGRDTGSLPVPAPAPPEKDPPSRTADVRPAAFKPRTHMVAPTPSAEMDYTFYPGQTAEPGPDELADRAKSSQEEYIIEPVFAKPLKRALPRAITATTQPRLTQSPAPGLPEPAQPAPAPAGDVAEFAGYQILPAAYTPAAERPENVYHDRVHAQHVEFDSGLQGSQRAPVYMPEPEQIHIPVPQHTPVYVPEPQAVYITEPQSVQAYAPAYAPEPQKIYIPDPQPVPVYTPDPQPTQFHIPDPKPVRVHIPEPQKPVQIHMPTPQPIPAQAHQPQPVPEQPQPQYEPQPDSRHMYHELDDDMDMLKKKRVLPKILGIAVILIVVAAAAFFVYDRWANVNPNHLVGTWVQSPPLGQWLPRLEFRADGTGTSYHFNTEHNVRRNENHFVWSIESGNRMVNSLWPTTAEISLDRGARPPRFSYRLDGYSDLRSFTLVVDP